MHAQSIKKFSILIIYMFLVSKWVQILNLTPPQYIHTTIKLVFEDRQPSGWVGGSDQWPVEEVEIFNHSIMLHKLAK